MSTGLITLPPDVTVAEAMESMCRNRVHNIPVVDKDGHFIGLFSLRRITHALLPVAARLGNDSFAVDMSFVSDNADAFAERLAQIGHKPISELLEKPHKLRFCAPDTSMPKIFQLLSENPTSLPVVVIEGESKTVVGMISTWDVLAEINAVLTPSQGASSCLGGSAADDDIGDGGSSDA
jgi:CBS domain-containing protein